MTYKHGFFVSKDGVDSYFSSVIEAAAWAKICPSTLTCRLATGQGIYIRHRDRLVIARSANLRSIGQARLTKLPPQLSHAWLWWARGGSPKRVALYRAATYAGVSPSYLIRYLLTKGSWHGTRSGRLFVLAAALPGLTPVEARQRQGVPLPVATL